MTLSVALCTYNGGRYLDAQLASIREQTRRPDEVVVGNDGSTDDTIELLQQFAAIAEFPVRIERNPTRLGSTANFDQTIQRCTSDGIVLCDQDDIWQPTKLARIAAEFADPSVDLVASDADLIGPSGEWLGRRLWQNLPFSPTMRAAVRAGNGPQLWVKFNTITGATAAFRSDLREIISPIPTVWVHDAWIALIAAAFGRVALIDDPLIQYRVHENQQIGAPERTPLWQITTAMNRDADSFSRVGAGFDAAADRLEQFRHRLTDPAVISLLRGKADFARVQARMRMGSRIGRLGPAVRGFVAGDYRRYSRGWKGFAADLFL